MKLGRDASERNKKSRRAAERSIMSPDLADEAFAKFKTPVITQIDIQVIARKIGMEASLQGGLGRVAYFLASKIEQITKLTLQGLGRDDADEQKARFQKIERHLQELLKLLHYPVVPPAGAYDNSLYDDENGKAKLLYAFMREVADDSFPIPARLAALVLAARKAQFVSAKKSTKDFVNFDQQVYQVLCKTYQRAFGLDPRLYQTRGGEDFGPLERWCREIMLHIGSKLPECMSFRSEPIIKFFLNPPATPTMANQIKKALVLLNAG